MSNGPIMDLVAKGEQDKYLLTDEIKSSIFYKEFNKHTNFSKGTVSFVSKSNTRWGGKVKFKIERIGDLLNSVYLVLKLPELNLNNTSLSTENYRVKWLDYIGNIIIKETSIYIGGRLIDKHSGEFMQVYNDVYDRSWAKDNLLGNNSSLNYPSIKIESEYIYVPLRFWFCISTVKSLPMVALQYHQVEIEIELRSFNECYNIFKFVKDNEGENTTILQHTDETLSEVLFTDLRLDCQFIFLDRKERKYIATKKHEILICQTQKNINNITSNLNLEIDFNHPVKDLIFVIQSNDVKNSGELFNFSGTYKYLPANINYDGIDKIKYGLLRKKHLLKNASMFFNGIERLSKKDHKYFHYLQNYEYYGSTLSHYIYLYSFSLSPGSLNPTGSVNFSMLDNAQLKVELNSNITEDIGSGNIILGPGNNGCEIKVFANNYNILQIEGGLCGLKYYT